MAITAATCVKGSEGNFSVWVRVHDNLSEVKWLAASLYSVARITRPLL